MASTGFSRLITILVALFMLASNIEFVKGQCRGNLSALISQCAVYVQKPGPQKPPSLACCDAVKTVDVPCVCSHITGEATQIISMKKAVYCAAFCGKALPHGFKCGGYIVP